MNRNINDVMINPTGLIKTDISNFDIIIISEVKTILKNGQKSVEIHNVPKQFIKIKNFLKPDFGSNPFQSTK